MLNIFGKKKMIAAFEFGLTLHNVAKNMNIELTPEIVQRAEDIILKELNSRSAGRVVLDTVPLMLTVFETDMTPKEEN